MNTRKNRKRTWKVQEQEFEEVKESPAEVVDDKKVEAQQQDSNRLLLFLQSWQESKEAQVNGTLRKDMPESIADLMSNKGYPISVNLARTKIMNFIKKYNLVKKMAAHGKPNEWAHFNTVKKILEFGPPILPSANVVIPLENIKSEVGLRENTLKIAERKVSFDAQKPTSGASNKRKSINLIEIGDDDTQLMKPRVYFSESEHIDDSDDSDMTDEDLDFENPLDKISFGFQSDSGVRSKQGVTPFAPKMMKLEKKIRSPMPTLNKIDNHIKSVDVPTHKTLAQASISGPQRPLQSKQQQIIPVPQTMNLPHTMHNGAPQQYLIVRPLTPGNAGNKAKTIAIPMGGQFRMGYKPPETTTSTNAQVLRPATLPESNTVLNHVKILPKLSSPLKIANCTSIVDSCEPPPLVSTSSHPISVAGTNVNGQTHANVSPCPSPGSATSTRDPTVRQLLSNVINLETNIYNLQKERLQLERERFEMERDYGKEMLNVFKEIKDKLCDMIPVPMASAATSTSNVISKGSELEHNKKE